VTNRNESALSEAKGLAAAAALLFVLACSPCGLLGSSATPASDQVKISLDAANRLEAELSKIVTRSGAFRLRITEEEATSYLALKMTEAPLANPQVRFRGGKIYLSGTFTPPLAADFSAISTAQVVNGQVRITIESMTLGPFPAPANLAASLNQTINETIAEAETKVTITEIQVLDRAIVIAGTKSP
jgi:hypothetical protein